MPPTVWYHVRDLDEGRRFYRELLGFEEVAVDFEEGWSHLAAGDMEIGLTEGEPAGEGVAHVAVDDVRAEAERLREAGVQVGIVVELPGALLLLEVYDPDQNRLELSQELDT
jgi:catechol 2,3-dioxygenase-like lactoylglutathione lyase family enzyme